MYQYEVIDRSFFETAPSRFDDSIVVPLASSAIWPFFESNADWHGFDPGIKKATWTSQPPLHPGSTRHVQLAWWLGSAVVNEVFFEWEENSQFAFYMKEGTSKMIHAYGEQWTLTDAGNNSTSVRMQTAFALNGWVAPHFVKWFSGVMNWGYKHTLRGFSAYVTSHHPE